MWSEDEPERQPALCSTSFRTQSHTHTHTHTRQADRLSDRRATLSLFRIHDLAASTVAATGLANSEAVIGAYARWWMWWMWWWCAARADRIVSWRLAPPPQCSTQSRKQDLDDGHDTETKTPKITSCLPPPPLACLPACPPTCLPTFLPAWPPPLPGLINTPRTADGVTRAWPRRCREPVGKIVYYVCVSWTQQ